MVSSPFQLHVYHDIERLTDDYGIMISQVLGERRRRKQVVHFEGILSDHGAATKIHAYFQDRHIYSWLWLCYINCAYASTVIIRDTGIILQHCFTVEGAHPPQPDTMMEGKSFLKINWTRRTLPFKIITIQQSSQMNCNSSCAPRSPLHYCIPSRAELTWVLEWILLPRTQPTSAVSSWWWRPCY